MKSRNHAFCLASLASIITGNSISGVGAVPDLAGLGLGGGRAEQEVDEGFSIPWDEGPKVAVSAKGWRGYYREEHEAEPYPEARDTAEKDAKNQEHAIEPQRIRQLHTGDGNGCKKRDASVEQNLRGTPMQTDSHVTY